VIDYWISGGGNTTLSFNYYLLVMPDSGALPHINS
jgi:hypothetical protein